MEDPLFTVAEAAERLGMTVDAVRKRIRRGQLQSLKGNDGLVRVRLTAADMASLARSHVRPTPSQELDSGRPPASQPDERERTIHALEAEAVTLREARDAERARAEKAEAEVSSLRLRLEQEAAAREDARIRAAAAEGEAKGLREALAEARRPFWRRWLG